MFMRNPNTKEWVLKHTSLFFTTMPPSQVVPTMDASPILLQGFNRESFSRQGGWYNFRFNSIPEIQASRITHVSLPPSSASSQTLVHRSKVCLSIIGWLFCLSAVLWASGMNQWIIGLLDVCLYVCLLLGPNEYVPEWFYDDYASRYASQDEVKTWIKKAFESNGVECVTADPVTGQTMPPPTQPAGGNAAAPFDLTTLGIRQATLGEGAIPEWGISMPTTPLTFTFIDSPFPSDKVMQGYVYILTHPGIPYIFYDHFFDGGLKGEITKLTKIRNKNKIKASSTVDILASEADLYVAAIDEKIIAKIGPRYHVGNLVPPTFKLVTCGIDYAVWEKQ